MKICCILENMDSVWIDYYKLLQVHFNAEQDMITAAYRRLSKKFHPDVNKSIRAEETMKRLNAAYQVLGDHEKRAEYNVEWIRRLDLRAAGRIRGTQNGFGTQGVFYGKYEHAACGYSPAHNKPQPGTNEWRAFQRIEGYYKSISSGDFSSAYNSISRHDRRRIKKSDFEKWQTAVSGTVELRDCEISFFKKRSMFRLGNKEFSDVFEFTVRICERDLSNDRITDYAASKCVVREGMEFGVYLGYRSLRPFISAFKQKNQQTVDIRRALDHWQDYQTKHDELTGLYNYTGFLDIALVELSRMRRYGGTLSFVVLDVVKKTGIGKSGLFPPDDDIIVFSGKLLEETLRDTDTVCHWNNGKYIIMLTETGVRAAGFTINRVCAEFNNRLLMRNTKERHHTIYAGVSAFDKRSLNSTLKKCTANLALAKRGKKRFVSGITAKFHKFSAARKMDANSVVGKASYLQSPISNTP